jgi:hypothetical protein
LIVDMRYAGGGGIDDAELALTARKVVNPPLYKVPAARRGRDTGKKRLRRGE